MTQTTPTFRGAIGAPTRVCGFTAESLHEQLWASLGASVVRLGAGGQREKAFRAYLLLEPGSFADFRLTRRLRSVLRRRRSLWLTFTDRDAPAYRERLEFDEHDALRAIRREYYEHTGESPSCVLTSDPRLAHRWSRGLDVVPDERFAIHRGRLFAPGHDEADAILEIIRSARRAGLAPACTRDVAPGVLAHVSATVSAGASITAPALIGASRRVGPNDTVESGEVLDDRNFVPDATLIKRPPLRPSLTRRLRASLTKRTVDEFATRAFDIAFALAMLAITAPLYPLIAALILAEDGRPVFFTQERLGRGGRPFRLFKFRTMRRDAERIRQKLVHENTCDGPQFHIPRDPRALRCGLFLRRWSIDELPQFINVLRGEMSVVGPRPLAEAENSCCPPWRERRLAVKPGVTGLWQIRRTRQPEIDFQEWVRYDTEYVSRKSFLFDLRIVLGTSSAVLRAARRAAAGAPETSLTNDESTDRDRGVVARIADGRIVSPPEARDSQRAA